MLRRLFLRTGLIVLLASCGGKVFIDDPDAGGAGGTGGAGASTGGGCITPCTGLDDACNVGVCAGGGCVKAPRPNGIACDDGLFCTTSDACVNGACTGAPLPCPAGDACNTAACDETAKGCALTPLPDSSACDGGSCVVGAACFGGTCSGQPVDCSALTGQCTVGVCQPGAGCVAQPTNEGAVCEDGDPCTFGEHCASGTCANGMGPTVFFFDDFHDNSKGWVLGPEWQIGPAQASPPGNFGTDPAQDHSASGDNGVAGAVLGGNVSTLIHPFSFLESPQFNTTGGPGPVVLQFYRWLNGDYPPFMHHTIEVWTGAAWKMIWSSPDGVVLQDAPPSGTGWTLEQFDLTPYKSATTKIRFGFDVASMGAFTIGGWNIDDVRVSSSPCN